MAGREHQPQQVVADMIVERGIEVRHVRLLLRLQLVPELLVLALQHGAPAELVDRTVLCRRHQPRARVVRHARRRPPLERREEGILRQILGESDVVHDASEPGDQLRRLHSPDRFHDAIDVRGRHGYQSDGWRRTMQGLASCRSVERSDAESTAAVPARATPREIVRSRGVVTLREKRQTFCWASTCARSLFSCSRTSGVAAAPKSSAENTWRISMLVSPPKCGFGARLPHSMASSSDFA